MCVVKFIYVVFLLIIKSTNGNILEIIDFSIKRIFENIYYLCFISMYLTSNSTLMKFFYV